MVPVVVGVVSLLSMAMACSSSSSGGGSGAAVCKNPPSNGSYSTACSSCEQSKCGSQYSALTSACSALLSCISGCDCTDETCIGGCATASNLTQSCQSADTAFGMCESANCASECSASSTSPDGGTTSPDDASGGGTYDAAAFAAATSCYKVSAGSSGSPGECTALTTGQAACGTGFALGLCPSQGLIGCCIVDQNATVSSADCVYAADQSPSQSACASIGGTWTTTPL